MDRQYSKRELDLMFKNYEEKNDSWNATILEKLEDLDKHRLTPTLEQAKKTNGRVDKLENWRIWLTGCAAVVVPISIWLFYKWVTIDQQINSVVEERFNNVQLRGTVEIK